MHFKSPRHKNSVIYFILLVTIFTFLQACSRSVSNAVQIDRQLSRDDQIKEAQVLNQEAQANYYNRQASNSANFWIAYSAPITAVVGILVAVLTLSLQSKNAAKLEDQKWRQIRADDQAKWQQLQDDELKKWKRLRDDEILRETRQAASELIKKIAIATHSMTWFLWVAQHAPEHFSRKLVAEHDELMKSLYAELAAAQVVLASLDKNLYKKTSEMVEAIYNFDGSIAEVAKEIDDADRIKDSKKYKKKVEELGEWWDDVYAFSKNLPEKFANMLDIKPDF